MLYFQHILIILSAHIQAGFVQKGSNEMVKWLNDAVFYEIYPQSFNDTNGDGIGDIRGIIEKLDYIKELGCNALWINPCYDSPFKDAGYDVRNYKLIAERYGTNEDMYELFEKAHEKGIHVLLDLVPGHTSEEHEWFQESCKAEKNEYSDRYVWTNSVWQGIADHPYIAGEAERDGVYMLNFFKCQPALNYGFLKQTEDWQMSIDAPGPMATREAIKDVIRFWLSHGADGFRVDMADSLVKNDDDKKSGTSEVWRYIFKDIRREYPEAAFVSEWCNPESALTLAGFDMDFYLDHHYNGYNTLFRDYETEGGDHSYFKKDAGGNIMRFLSDYMGKYTATRDDGYISFLTCNHDTPRCTNTLSIDELKIAYSFLFTMPGVPFLYYGDEIGMRYLKIKSHEGGFQRTGSRTPMQWTNGRNKGFSDADADRLYLGVDESEGSPDVESAIADPDSIYHTVKDILSLRHKYEDLQATADFEVVYAHSSDPLFIYRRGMMIIAVNPSGQQTSAPLNLTGAEKLFEIGSTDTAGGSLTVEPQSFAVYMMG